MSRSRRNKKHKRGVRLSRASSYNPDEQPESIDSPQSYPQGRALASSSADGSRGSKDGGSPAVPPPTDSELELCSQVRVFSLDKPPKYLFSIGEWQARDAQSRGEATFLCTGKRIRGIQYVAKTSPDPVTPEKAGTLRSRTSPGDVHHHDTDLNPVGVYTFYPLPPSKADDRFIRSVFAAVLNSCQCPAARSRKAA